MHSTKAPSADDKYEHSDWHLKLVLVTGVGMVIVTLLAFALGYVILKGFDARPAMTDFVPSPMAEEHSEWTEDLRLQEFPWDAYDVLKEKQSHDVDSYGIVSESPEIYQIPIEVAMEIVAEDGLVKIDAVGSPTGEAATSTEH